MKTLLFLCFLFFFFSSRVSSQEHASIPPRGWNSYDSFCWTISEQEFLDSASIMSNRLLKSGYEYAVVDYLWYRRKVPGAYVDSLGFDVIDKWGRPQPEPARWPSSNGGKGFTEVSRKVHGLGLKFGIHVMRGISTQAVNENTPILDTTTGKAYVEAGRTWTAKDIGIKERRCAWMQNGFMSVNTALGAGKAFLRSLYLQYSEWGVDFIKNDCVFGDDIDAAEISIVSEVLKELDHPVLYSLSPGTSARPALVKNLNGLVNMYRITGDDWDNWGDVVAHFDVTRDFAAANMIGAPGLLGKSWPDLDMLPLGWLTDPGSNDGPHRQTKLTLEEQKTQVTLWSMAKSPLMFGGDMRKLDDTTYSLITNPTLLEINSFSSNNKEFLDISSSPSKRGIGNGHPFHIWQSTRHLTDLKTSDSPILGLTSCTDEKAMGWSTKALDQDLEHICWKENSRKKHQAPFCLNKREPLVASGEEMMYKEKYEGKINLLATDREDICLHASPKRKLTSKEDKRDFFSPCRWDANQMWELNPNGTLANSYSGLCATVDTVKAKSNIKGVRSWIATGRQGEVYVAFFNLNSVKTTISAQRSDLAKALPGSLLTTGACRCTEEWSSQDMGIIDHSISFAVESHGAALLGIHCDGQS